jgi:hypothetical protein
MIQLPSLKDFEIWRSLRFNVILFRMIYSDQKEEEAVRLFNNYFQMPATLLMLPRISCEAVSVTEISRHPQKEFTRKKMNRIIKGL